MLHPEQFRNFHESEVIAMESSVPAEHSPTMPSDDRLSALLYLSQQLNAERDVPRLLDLMVGNLRGVWRLSERVSFCWIAPPMSFGL